MTLAEFYQQKSRRLRRHFGRVLQWSRLAKRQPTNRTDSLDVWDARIFSPLSPSPEAKTHSCFVRLLVYDQAEHSESEGKTMTDRASSAVKQRHRLPAFDPRYSTTAMRMITAIMLSAGLTQVGWAGEVTVQISKRQAGDPVQAAAVCLGTPANIAQFGAQLADEKGTVRFDKVHTRAELVLTVSKSGFKGRQVFLGTAQRDQGVLLTLAAGGGGPKCATAVPVIAPVQTSLSRGDDFFPGITDFRINGGQHATRNPKVTLSYALSGEASHYRVSTRPDFKTTEWRPLEPNLEYSLSGEAGLKTVYFQVGKFRSAEGAEIEVLSNVAVDTIVLTGS